MKYVSRNGYISLQDIDNIDEFVDDSVSILLNDGVILTPTDTVYGLICKPTSEIAIHKIFAMKNRPVNRHLPIICSDQNQVQTMLPVIWTQAAQKLADNYWPGAMTIACGVNTNNDLAWLDGRVEVGIRVPNHTYIQKLAEKMGPLLMTSANKHGEDTPHTIDGALGSLAIAPELAVDGGLLSGEPSTLVNVNLPKPEVERIGSISKTEIERLLYHE